MENVLKPNPLKFTLQNGECYAMLCELYCNKKFSKRKNQNHLRERSATGFKIHSLVNLICGLLPSLPGYWFYFFLSNIQMIYLVPRKQLFKNKFIYLFIIFFGCVGSSLLRAGFL